jgi:hypothetical protein
MIRIVLDNLLTSQESLLDRNLNSLNFREIICMIFHATKNIYEKRVDTHDKKWSDFYNEFLINLEAQNKIGWAKLVYITNQIRRRLEIFSPSSFVPSKNLLVQILRLLYIEDFKMQNLPLIENKNFYEILTYKIDIPDKYTVRQVSLPRLFEILKLYVGYYIRIYENGLMYECVLGKAIFEQI